MMILLRVEMPDRAGSLGKVASAIGAVGADIVGVRIVGRQDGRVVDDFICQLPPGAMVDKLASAFPARLDAKVLWLSHCTDQWDLITEAELVSQVAAESDDQHGIELIMEHLPMLFHCQWLAIGSVTEPRWLRQTEDAPELTPERLAALEPLDEVHTVDLADDWAPGWGETTVAVVPNGNGRLAIMGRRGGPQFLSAELRRLRGLVSLLS